MKHNYKLNCFVNYFSINYIYFYHKYIMNNYTQNTNSIYFQLIQKIFIKYVLLNVGLSKNFLQILSKN